jgi:hypothetical protein
MSGVLALPKAPIAPSRINPRISIFYGPPKIGKTTEVAKLDHPDDPGHRAMILDYERGTELITSLKIPISSISGGTGYNPDGTLAYTSSDAVYEAILAEGVAEFNRTGKKPRPPYKFLIVDTIDKMEDYCEVTATEKYKLTTIGKNFTGKSVLELPQGAGYYHLRQEVIFQIDRLSTICEHLILVSHIKDKVINKGGIDVSVNDISLTGRLGAIVCAKADVIGYMYREPGKPGLQISFETFENNVMGARIPRLAGRKFPMDWNEVFLPADKLVTSS